MASTRRIPNFITAASPQGLRRLMLKNNIRMGSQVQYEIMNVGGKWYAWFNEDVEQKDAVFQKPRGSK